MNNNNYGENTLNGEFMERIVTKEEFMKGVKIAMESFFENSEVKVTKIVKSNDMNYLVLTVHTKESNFAPTIYLDSYYDEFRAGKSWSAICLEIMIVASQNRDVNIDVFNVFDFESIKSSICFKLINKSRNKNYLIDVPYIDYLDLAIIMFVVISIDNRGVRFITVNEKILESWGIKNLNELFTLACKNSKRLFPAKIQTLTDVMLELGDYFVSDSKDVCKDNQIPLYLATNIQNIDGANVMLYEELLKKFAEDMGTDFYILPSSIHELIFCPTHTLDVQELRNTVNTVNMNVVKPEEFLSNNVYLYHVDTNCVELIEF